MKRYLIPAVVVATVLFLFTANTLAADPNTPVVPKVIKGVVGVTKDKEGTITSVTITHRALKYFVTLDEKGKEMGMKMDGKTVEARGIITVKDEQKWLTVEKYVQYQKPAAKSRSKHNQ
jgi:hypothetical protein